jgi:NodT family efflux transporter outer membrane factor (OMF) lipoprotein
MRYRGRVGVTARLALLAGTALLPGLLAGCEVGPDFVRPAAPDIEGYTSEPLPVQTASAGPAGASNVAGGIAQRFVARQDIPAQWWTLYESQPLSDLIAEAIRANPDLQSAEASLRQAQENAAADRGALWPSLDVTGGPQRQRTPTTQFGTSNGQAQTFTLYNARANVSYNVDVFGGTRRQIEASDAAAENARFQLEATYLALTANVVTAAVNDASLRAQIAATQDIIRIQRQSLNLLQSQLALGGINRSDVLTQEAALRQTEATLPPLQLQLTQNRHRLMALAGRFASRDNGVAFELAQLRLPVELPVSVPSDMINQRPDVRAAEAQVHQASAEVGIAVANRLPQFAISADVGTAALTLGSMFSGPTALWSVAGTVTQPLFHGGTLLHRQRAAEAALAAATATYRGTVIGAVQNVADALRALQFDAEALRAEVAAERAAAASLALSRGQFQAGAITYLTLLTAQQTYQTARLNLAKAQAARFADTAALFQALGGGWWNRPDLPATQAAQQHN